ncbi:MAG: NAD(P)-dependent alcohol dehydrogenase [Lacunisphaera sp.]|nr:NAD(P)-dependent alcohol dehydrogenase [Lacunisphaera sp.]
MRAVTYTQFGGTEVLRISDVADPVAGRGELVARVRAASMNPLDWKIRAGTMNLLAGKRFPKGTGFDFSGVVESCGPEVVGLKPGDEIFGQLSPFALGSGTFAEKCIARTTQVVLKPAALSFAEAAAAPCAGMSALQSLRHCQIGQGSRVLLIGASGGLGLFAIPMAKRLGAQVTAVCSGQGIDLVRRLGADVVIDRQKANPLALGQEYDAVLDLAAVSTFFACRHLLAPRGIYLNTMPGAGTLWSQCWTALFSARKARVLMLKPSARALEELGAMMAIGEVRPRVGRIFPLDVDSVREMHRLSQDGHVLGKLVLELPAN